MSSEPPAIYSIVFTSDGRCLIAPGPGNAVCIYAASDGALVRAIGGNEAPIKCLAVSPDARILATGAEDNSVRAFELASGRELWVGRAHKSWVWDVEFSPDGQRLYSASRDCSVAIWSLRDGSLILRKRLHDDEINGLAISPDGALVATASDDKTVRLWTADLASLAAVCEGHSGMVNRVRFLADGNLASCDTEGEVRVWSPEGRLVHSFRDHGVQEWARKGVWGLAVGRQTGCIVSAGVDGLIAVRLAKSGEMVARLYAHETITAAALREATGEIATGSEHGWIRVRVVGRPGQGRILVKADLKHVMARSEGSTGLAHGDDDHGHWPPEPGEPSRPHPGPLR